METAVANKYEPQIDLKRIDGIIQRYVDERSALIALLQDIQKEYNYLPKEALRRVAEKLEVPFAQIYSLATFYRAFSLNPKGKHRICVCTGTACHVKGAQEILDRIERELGVNEGETTPDGLFSVEEVRCVGACGLAPIISVGEQRYGRLTQGKLLKIIDNYRKGGEVNADNDSE
jgi:NADH-quinone oxidoreductase E subunit